MDQLSERSYSMMPLAEQSLTLASTGTGLVTTVYQKSATRYSPNPFQPSSSFPIPFFFLTHFFYTLTTNSALYLPFSTISCNKRPRMTLSYVHF